MGPAVEVTWSSAMSPTRNTVPPTMTHPLAGRFWLAVLLTGSSTGFGAVVLTRLLEEVQSLVWGGSGTGLLEAVQQVPVWHLLLVLLLAGIATGAGQVILKRLSSANGIDTATAIWFHAGRLPAVRTLGSAVLSVIIVAMGASLGREGAPKQAGAVFANFFCDRLGLSDEQRRLLVACGAGAGMSAAYGVPIGGALFSLEVMRGVLALRYVLPSLVASAVATGIAWLWLPNAPLYRIPEYPNAAGAVLWAALMGPVAGLVSVGYVRLISWADRNKPATRSRIVAPILGLGCVGLAAVWFPQILGNGRDVSQATFLGWHQAFWLAAVLLVLKPAATAVCVRTGAPGGLFTPSLTVGALLGTVLGAITQQFWPGAPLGLCALVGAGAVLAATTQGPISTIVLLIEFTGRDRAIILPLLAGVATATLVARTIEFRSIYEARLTDEQLKARQIVRDGELK
ncbi:MAG: chloride channel protein [Acidobacteria bacterium]|nr:chloride channel protein [Acidobacteriota bacterium]